MLNMEIQQITCPTADGTGVTPYLKAMNNTSNDIIRLFPSPLLIPIFELHDVNIVYIPEQYEVIFYTVIRIVGLN